MANHRYKGNSTYGASGDKHNPLYDPRMCRCVCVTGQLLLIDLIEHIEPYCNLLQSNTDGVYLSFDDENNMPIVENIMHEWERRTRLTLEIDYANGIWQKDCNNYIMIEEDGLKTKGAYVKKLSKVDYNLAILNKAVVNYFVKNEPIEETINNCTNLIDFQQIIKIGGTYSYCSYGDTKLRERVLRVFATKDESACGVFKYKDGGNPEKIADTPEHCMIINDDVTTMQTPDWIDREFYIAAAKDRLDKFLNGKEKSKIKNEIKGVANEVKNAIEKINSEHIYETFYDLLADLSSINCNNSQLITLIKLDYLSNYGDINWLLFYNEYYQAIGKCKNLKVEKARSLKIPAKYLEQYSDKHTEKTYTGIHNKELLTTLMSIAKIRPCTIYDKIKWQMELLGYCNLTDPNAAGDMFLVNNIEQTNYNIYITLYRLYDAWQQKYKVNKKFYTKNPLQSGDIIQVIFEEKPKWKKVDDEFVRTGETEIIIKGYRKMGE